MKKSYYISLVLLFTVFSLFAQQVTVSPLPRTAVWGDKAFDKTTTYRITGENTADQDAVAALKSNLTVNVSGGGVEIIVGERGDAAVKSVAAEIPAVKEGYYLKVEPGKVTIAGNDTVGTFYGVQSFLQIASSPEVMSVTIKDYPSVIERGVVEGFYGNPFSHADRLRQFDFYGKYKMNAYVYGPKDDAYHGFGTKWRDAYPADLAAKMVELITAAHKNKVNFIWAVHPGNNISWDDTNNDGVVDDFVACVNKFEKMYLLGVRSFAVFFDDIGGIGADPANQAKMLNYLNANFVKKKPDVEPLMLCPTQYNRSWSSGDYLSILGTQMDKSVRIMWTGNSVVDMINKSDMDWINAQISRNAYIWLNYPVNDYVVDHLLMGPVYGNDLNIAPQLSGFVANPMEYAEASKVALYSIADYCWNMPAYNSNASWLRAMRAIMPDNYNSFKIFCENNVDLGPTYHGLRRDNESAPFNAAATAFMTAYNQNTYNQSATTKLAEQFQSFRDAAADLTAATHNPELITEIKPWLKVFDIMGQKGLSLVKMYQALNTSDSVSFISQYQKIDSLEKVQSTIRSRDFPGSIKAPYPKPANEVVAPFIKQLKSSLITEYRRKFKYMTDIFPKIILEEGRYHIRYNGKYLTNKNANGTGGNPVFVTEPDAINPARQEWTLSIDPKTDRYKIINTQDSRYVNELGNFGTNAYDAAWNTYYLHRYNRKYAIQNAGAAGDKIWTVTSDRFAVGADNKLDNSDFMFEIIPIGEDTIDTPVVDYTQTYYIKSGDGYLTNTNVNGSGGAPAFKPLITPAAKSQQWKFTEETATKHIKLVSAADGRYVNELGAFGTNAYFPKWNSYILTELGGLFSIQNADDAGTKFWTVNNNRIEQGGNDRTSSFLFRLIPTKKMEETSVKSTKSEKKKYQLKVEKNKVSVNSDDVKALKLYALNGALIRETNNSSEIPFLEKGMCILSITDKTNNTFAYKIARN